MRITVIMPVLDEAVAIRPTLDCLQAMRARGHEVIVVDGGSADATPDLAAPLADQVVRAEPGRARQMNAGASVATGDLLWFLHADTRPSDEALRWLEHTVSDEALLWGRFDVRIQGRSRWLPVVAFCMNLRSRITGIATGDQGIFVSRQLFDRVGGYPCIPLMEDITLSRSLLSVKRPLCARHILETSGRRWDEGGALRVILLMWRLRLAYFLGADPVNLARRYK